MVDEDEVMELVDQLRFNLPEEMKQANWTVQEQQRLISEAHSEAARIMSKANDRAEQAVRDHEVLRRAEREAQQGLREARTRSDQIVREAEIYALEQLQQLEAHLSRTLNTVKRGVEALQSSTAAPRPEGDEEEPAASTDERMERTRY
jgi:vacuolar-type H+-ATPase subunit H